jgi:hypothetical protein
VRASLGGDPLEFRVFGAAISLRREQAKHFEVTRVGARAGAAGRSDFSRDSSVAAEAAPTGPAPKRP